MNFYVPFILIGLNLVLLINVVTIILRDYIDNWFALTKRQKKICRDSLIYIAVSFLWLYQALIHFFLKNNNTALNFWGLLLLIVMFIFRTGIQAIRPIEIKPSVRTPRR